MLFETIRGNAGPLLSRSSLQIGYAAYRLKDENLFGILGYATEDEARDDAGVGSSTWYSVIRIAEQFKNLSEELFVGMKLANAKELADLPESKRLDVDWIEKATTMKIKAFARLVAEEMEGKARPSEGKERSVKLVVNMPTSRKDVIAEKVVAFAEAHGMDAKDTGQVLEAMAVESTGGETMTGAILKAIEAAKEIKRLVESGLSSDEVLTQVIPLNEQIILDLSGALGATGREETEAA
jgi:hypothetical protein